MHPKIAPAEQRHGVLKSSSKNAPESDKVNGVNRGILLSGFAQILSEKQLGLLSRRPPVTAGHGSPGAIGSVLRPLKGWHLGS